MRRPTCCGFWSILTITILKFPAVEASSLSAENWPFANGASDANANANDIFDLNAPGEGEEDWTFSDILGNNPFAAGQGEGDDAVAIASSGIYQLPDTTTTTIFNLDDDNHQLFMDNDEDGDGPPQTNANAEWLADLGPQPNNEQEGEEKEEKEECSSSDLPGKKRLARRNGICSPSSSSSSSSSSFSRGSAGPVHSNPRVSITEASTFDQQNCPTGSYKIKSLFVCSSPEVSKSVASVPPTWTLYDSQRVLDPSGATTCTFPSALYCCGDWIPNPPPFRAPAANAVDAFWDAIADSWQRVSEFSEVSEGPFLGIGVRCVPFGLWAPL